ncbi:ATP-citrate synthase alpha chain protein 1 [Phtheirospermum japonicum]|uniref:ATP-citrate synthase alpha chain protein 1 n=1 Tax=Phtheirospermum japonicum TaxID=374723 RepID=A0A830CUX6_9LAMI|nr:ATP-citrate synthase alpha chain protein 1 [Phtheirospermum japonicum]
MGSGLVALNLDLAGVAAFVKEHLGKEIKDVLEEFIKSVYALFLDLDFTFLEMNPFTLVDGKPYPLDMGGELDDTATFKNFKKWGNIEFPMPFGRVMSPTESFIHGLDEKTSASLKLTVLNPKGRIWTMVAGGGASVIYADTNRKLSRSRLILGVIVFSDQETQQVEANTWRDLEARRSRG